MKNNNTIKKMLTGSIIFFCLFLQLKPMELPVEKNLVFDEALLDDIAVSKGYGYKYANLRELEKLAHEINNGGLVYTIAVPAFAGISSSHIQDFIKHKGFDIAARWAEIIEKHFGTDQSNVARTKVLSEKRYPKAFLEDQKIFEHELRMAFELIAGQKQISPNKQFSASGVDEILQIVHKNGERLMVRSTGKEDTKKLANAGGNVSKANVKPERQDVISALFEVVVSYFTQKSLKQRLGAGDESIFEAVPFTPVLIQRMIGEMILKRDKEPTKCGVMFTEEPEGGIAHYDDKDEKGRIRTTGITIIQAAYGHNEGVVNSLVPVDTYYLDRDRTIYPVICPKTYRMIPDLQKPRSLMMVKNDEKLVHVSSLSKDALISLKILADRLEEYYNSPMDVEFVINEDEKTIYVVQARPLVYKQGLRKASYITMPEKLKQDSIASGQSIGVAGGSLRLCTDKSQLIVVKNIGQALATYQDQDKTPDTNVIECIIVGAMAAATSHEATTFRNEGKPVVCIEQQQSIGNWLKKATKIVVSPQQGLVTQWSEDWSDAEKSVQGLINSKAATEGWINYPIPSLISLSSEFAPLVGDRPFDQIIQSFLPEGRNFESFLKKADDTTDLASLVTILKKGSEEDASVALAEILFTLRFMLKQAHGGVEKIDTSYQRRIRMIMRYAISCAEQIKKNLHAQPDDKMAYPCRLFPIRFLESVLFQKPQLGEIEDGMISAQAVLKGLAAERDLYKKLRDLAVVPTPQMVKLMRFGQLAMMDWLRQSWDNFVIGLVKAGNQTFVDEFEHMVLAIGQMGVLPIWLHSSFSSLVTTLKGPHKIFKELKQEFDAADNFIRQLQGKLVTMKSFNVSSFDNPKNFTALWSNFNQSLLEWFVEDDFLTQFLDANNLGQLIATGIMTSFVNDVFDKAIKAVTGSEQFSEDTPANFNTMLKGYNELLKGWVTLVPTGGIKYGGAYGRKMSASSYIDIISKILSRTDFSHDDLKRTPGFNLLAFTIGSGMDLDGSDVQKPKTGEDAFMIIHQCLLFILNVLSSEATFKDLAMPEDLEVVLNSFKEEIKAELISRSLSKDTLILFFNKPLRDHSVQFEFCYNIKSKKLTLIANFFGDNMDNRWDIIAHYAFLLNATNILAIDEVDLSNSGVRLVIPITKKPGNTVLWGNLNVIINASYGEENLDIDYSEIKRSVADSFLLFKELIENFGFESTLKNPWVGEILIKSIDDHGPEVVKIALDIIKMNKIDQTRILIIGMNLFKEFIKKDQEFELVLDVALKSIQSIDNYISGVGVDLFVSLIQKQYQPALDMRVKVAEEILRLPDGNGQSQEKGLEIFDQLFLQKDVQIFDDGLQIAQSLIKVPPFKDDSWGIKLLGKLIQLDYKPALASAVSMLEQDPIGLSDRSTRFLAGALIEKNYTPSYDVVFGLINKYFKLKPPVFQKNGTTLLEVILTNIKKLVDQGDVAIFDQASKIAVESLIKTDIFEVSLPENSLRKILFLWKDLLSALFEQNQVYEQGLHALQCAVFSKNMTAQNIALMLVPSLLEKKDQQIIERIFKIAIQAQQSQDLSISSVGKRLLAVLTHQNYIPAFDYLIQSAVKEFKNKEELTRNFGIESFKILFDKDYKPAFEQALEQAVTATGDSNILVQNSGRVLFKALLEKNYRQNILNGH